ncbi:protein CIP2A homolog [Patiria miniata]|uniref:CIP2A N-terminal domain-containing protein n=1 Tax=Patiria miniata TaxID=46514 RepID=A0A914B946_PATMI|nr:protein CIP2A homolog [Patiria miniata]XP_038072704.1 protein CIP2A homolog [Patiria miniata]
MEDTATVKAVVLAANQYSINPSDSNLVQLQRKLDTLIGICSRGKPLVFFSTKQLLPTECLTCLVDILNEQTTPTELAQRTMVLLFSLAADSEIRETLQTTYNLPVSLASYLRVSMDSAGEQVIMQCVQLLQRVTYNYHISYLNNTMEDLVRFLISNVQRGENELTMPCLGLLANLCRHNASVQAHIKSIDNLKAFYRTLIHYLSHSSLTVIVFSLSILSNLCLNEELGEKLFSAKNISQTFQLVFNILLNGEGILTRRYAVDVFVDLLKSPKIQRFLIVYEHFPVCLQQVLKLVTNQEAETVNKIFELLLAFCAVTDLRPTVCKNLMATPPLQNVDAHSKGSTKLSTSEPFLAIVTWASQPVDLHESVSLLAVELLKEVYEEMIDSGLISQLSPRIDLLLPMASEQLTTPTEMDGPLMKYRCNKLTMVINLLMALSGDSSLRSEVAGVLNVQECFQILEHQYNHNRIGLTMSRTAVDSDWSEAGVNTVLQLLDLLLKLRRDISQMDQQLVRVLQDERLVPFLAHAITTDQRVGVQTALRLISTASTLPEFPSIGLGESIAARNSYKSEEIETLRRPLNMDNPGTHAILSPRRPQPYHYERRGGAPVNGAKEGKQMETNIQSLIDKMQSGLDLKDMRASEIMDVYEHKLSSLATKESHLQDLLEAKALALAQADRLIAQYRCRRAQSEAEARKLRSLLQDSEKRSEEYRENLFETRSLEQKMALEIEKVTARNKQLQDKLDLLEVTHTEQTRNLETVQRALSTLRSEHQTLKEMHEVLQRHNETLREQQEKSTVRLGELEDERDNLQRNLRDKETRLTDTTATLEQTQERLAKIERERDEFEKALDNLGLELQKMDGKKKELTQQVSSFEVLCRQHESDLRKKEATIKQLKVEVDKHAQITQMIHSLTGGKPPS